MRFHEPSTFPQFFCLANIPYLTLGLLASLAPLPASAQDGTSPAWLDVTIVQVEGGEGPNFEDRVRDLQAARQEAGLPALQVFQVVQGHPNEYHLVTPVASISENEGAPPPMAAGDFALWVARITETVDSVRFFYARLYPDQNVAAPANAPQPTLLLLRTIRVVFGRESEYESWVADEYVPAFRQTSPLGHTFSRGVFGDSPQHFYHAYPIADWAVLDAPDPLLDVLGQQRYEELFDGVEGIVESHELVVATIRTDLMPQEVP